MSIFDNTAKLPDLLIIRVFAMMTRILRFASVALMAIGSAVFIYGMIQARIESLPPQLPRG